MVCPKCNSWLTLHYPKLINFCCKCNNKWETKSVDDKPLPILDPNFKLGYLFAKESKP